MARSRLPTQKQLDATLKSTLLDSGIHDSALIDRITQGVQTTYTRLEQMRNGARWRIDVTLSGAAQLFDAGFPAFDMKRALLASPKAKRGKTGPYIRIPLFWTRAKLPAIGYLTELARKRAGSRAGAKEVLAALAWQKGPLPVDHYVNPHVTPDGGVLRKRGLLDAYTAPVGSKGRTYRTVSTKSEPDAWQHPGFRPLAFLERYLSRVSALFNK